MSGFATLFPDSRRAAFIGRDDEMASAIAAMREAATRLLTVTGPAGVGKTRFAVELASQLTGDYDDGTIVIDLATINDPEAVTWEMARAIGMRARQGARLAEQIDAWLAAHAVLLLFDNAEHVLGIGPQLAHWLSISERSRALVTSRHRLNLSLERELYLHPLDVADVDKPAGAAPVRHSSPSPASQLFLRMAGVDPKTVDPATLNQVERVCAWLDGLPLAMELVAARLPELTSETLDLVLTHRDGISTPDDIEINSALEAAVDWSYRLLTPAAQQLLRYLTVFVGGFSMELVERQAIHASRIDLGGSAVVDCVMELTDHHLILPVPDARIDVPRFRMLMMVMETVRHRLITHGEDADAHEAHALAITGYAEHREYSGVRPKFEYQVGELSENDHNITAALTWYHSHRNGDALLRLVGALTWYWYAHGHYGEGQTWFERTLKLDITREGVRWARFLTGYGILLDVQGQFERAREVLLESCETNEASDRPEGVTAAHLALGVCSFHLERHDDAERHLLRAIELSRGISDAALAQTAEGLAWENLGASAHEQGNLEEAEDALRRAIAIHQRAGFRWGEARAQCDLGSLLRDRGDLHDALEACQAALVPATQVADSRLIAAALAGLATILAHDKQAMLSAWFWGAVDALRPVMGNPSHLKVNLRAYERGQHLAQEALGDAGYAIPFRTGRRAPMAEAVALAREVSISGGHMLRVSPSHGRELTDRERDVLQLLVQGASTRAIGAALGITERTVSSHIGSLFRKYGVNSRLELIAMTAQLHS